jgi:hypothetical protein
MPCLFHPEPSEYCMTCLGRWDRVLAERLLREGCTIPMLAAALRLAIATIDQHEREATITFEAMAAEIEALRCGDLVAFSDGELAPDRADAFRLHLGACTKCGAGLHGLMQEGAAIATRE